MTDEDVRHREAIRALVTRYNIHGDRGRFDDLAACFTEDGTLTWTANSGTGRAGIVAGLKNSTGGNKAITVIRHNLTTMHIELDEDRAGATGRIYFFVISNAGPDHAGVYVDRYARVGEEWLIATRQVRVDWRASVSVYQAAE